MSDLIKKIEELENKERYLADTVERINILNDFSKEWMEEAASNPNNALRAVRVINEEIAKLSKMVNS